jgi:hypothetical protein
MTDHIDQTPAPEAAIGETADFQPPMTQDQFFDQLENTDPLRDMSSVWAGSENLDLRGNTPITAFSPEDRKMLQEKANAMSPGNPNRVLQSVIDTHVREKSAQARLRHLPDDASQYHRELAVINSELRENTRRAEQIERELVETRKVIDPVTGKEIDTGKPLVTDERRKALMGEYSTIIRRMEAIEKSEGTRRLTSAAKQDWEKYVETERARFEVAEVDRRAQRLAAEARINKQAEARARGRYGLRDQ